MTQRVTKSTLGVNPSQPRRECPGDDSIQIDLDRFADDGNPNTPDE